MTGRIRDTGQNVLQSSFVTGNSSSSSTSYFYMFFLIAFLEEAFIRNDIIFMQRINYIYNLIIICIHSNNVVSNNNTVINNNYRRFQDLILLLKIPTEMRKGLKVFCKECKR
jgi:hypothetical protein